MNLNNLVNYPQQRVSLPPISDILINQPPPYYHSQPLLPPLIRYNSQPPQYNYYYGQSIPVRKSSSPPSPSSPSVRADPYQTQQIYRATKIEDEDDSSDDSHKRKTRNNLPKETTYILLRWLNDHLNHPYPNSFEKNQLMMSTGLNQQQLSNWFINARRRKIKSLKEQKRLNLIWAQSTISLNIDISCGNNWTVFQSPYLYNKVHTSAME